MDNVEIITNEEELSSRCEEIDPRKEGKLAQEITIKLKNKMRELDCCSLSAPQIGYKKRIFCVRFGKDDYRTILNPIITNVKNLQFARETCHSIPGKEFIRPRFNTVQVIYTTPMGKIESRNVVGKSAVVFQHCIDHLDGLLLSDIGLEIDKDWDNLTDEEQNQIIQMYRESLDIKQKEISKEINEDKDLKEINDAIKFMDSVNKGETELVPRKDVDNKTEDTPKKRKNSKKS